MLGKIYLHFHACKNLDSLLVHQGINYSEMLQFHHLHLRSLSLSPQQAQQYLVRFVLILAVFL